VNVRVPENYVCNTFSTPMLTQVSKLIVTMHFYFDPIQMIVYITMLC